MSWQTLAFAFTVQAVEFQGLQRIQRATALNYLEVNVGDKVTEAKYPAIIRRLFRTGFFSNVQLIQRGNTLVVRVVEKPIIAKVKITGNESIPKDKLNEAIDKDGLRQGQIYNERVLNQLVGELRAQYHFLGKYNATIEPTIKRLVRNRVDIKVKINEGGGARIKQIRIIGNKVYKSSVLRHQLLIGERSLLGFVTGKDKYSQDKLAGSLENLTHFYQDNGYLHFRIVSTQVSLDPNRKHVYITIKIEEGARYHFSGYAIRGNRVLSDDAIRASVLFQKGDVFAKSRVTMSITALGYALGDLGYAFPVINAVPKVDEINKTIFITFMVSPGQQFYVRRITFGGNYKTRDNVLRAAMIQLEGARLSRRSLEESKRRMQVKNYIKTAEMKLEKVPGTNNQVDLHYEVTEAPSAVVTAQFSWSPAQGIGLNAGFNQSNFMGTGQSVGLNFNAGRGYQSYAFSWFDPYYTVNGVGRGYTVYYNRASESALGVNGYSANRLGGLMTYNVPLGVFTSMQASLGYEHVKIALPAFDHPDRGNDITWSSGGYQTAPDRLMDSMFLPNQPRAYTQLFGTIFNQVKVGLGWHRNTYDRFPFPTSGSNQQLDLLMTLPGGNNTARYYKASYTLHKFMPLGHGFIFSILGSFGFGNGYGHTEGLPFFENYHAGGISSHGQVRGYEAYSLGPLNERGDPLGGNILAAASAELILPYPLSRERIRTSIFVDVGNVFSINAPSCVPVIGSDSVIPYTDAAGNITGFPRNVSGTVDLNGYRYGPLLRVSAGIAVQWQSPFGPLTFSLAKPLTQRYPGDRTEPFAFSVTTGF